ncbi:hypothetical protein [Bacillus sp. 1NLA3E]|uniref:hypothetical protein n=1 Tax=Bacillus sp. 1NLA3E TaxID=666686 RepID=UPI000247E2C5|nr:hypothetical protein [Bacillus sp. 1NLA3E]AGK55976.1 hypothetical protein B1NLA3E_21190 [Bacillus sp. 1NLA3E]
MLKIMSMLSCSANTAAYIMLFIDASSVIGLIMALTGVGFAAAAAVFALKATIKRMAYNSAIAF